MKVSVQKQDFDLGTEVGAISKRSTIGAVASFVGLVREVRMTLEHYPGMTENAIRKGDSVRFLPYAELYR